jgi:uncharacterized protein YbcV (DUF1398 family)
MGMMVVGSSASYADVDSSYNQEAINVAQAVGIMTGDENGNFNPDNGVTRNEMAVIMCNLLDLKVGSTTSPFTDVDSWAAPYVAACYNNGIVAGITETTFGGNNSVTSAQAALMVMKALGYFGYQGEFGQDWKVAVTKKANQISLFEDVNTYVDQALTRNEVAQLVLNALESTVQTVTESGGVSVATGDVAVSVQATYTEKPVVNTSYNYDASGEGAGYQQLCEKLYGKDLVKTSDTTDDMGRPSTKWTYKGTEVQSTNTPDAVYTDAVALKDVYAALNLAETETINVYLNGKNDASVDPYVTVTIGSTKGKSGVAFGNNANSTVQDGTFLNAKTDDKKIGGPGYTIEFYVDNNAAAGKQVTAVAYTEFLAKATADYNTEDESVGIETYGNLGLTELKSEDFDNLESIKEDDYLLITVAPDGSNWKAMSVTTAQVVSGVTATGTKSRDNITAGGTTYKFDIYTSKVNTRALGYAQTVTATLDHDYDLILNSNGYVIGIEDAASGADLSDIVFLKKVAESGFDITAKLVFMSDGTSATVTLNKVDSNDATTSNAVAGRFYAYTVKSNGEYDLKTTISSSAQGKLADTHGEIKTGTVSYTVNGRTLAADGDTVYVHDDRYSVGVKNSPTIKATSGVYVLYDDTDLNIRAVYTPDRGKVSSTADQYVYILGYDGRSYDGDDYYHTYKVVVNGEKTTMNFTDTVDLETINDTVTTTDSSKDASGLAKGLYKIEGYDDDYVSDLTYYAGADNVTGGDNEVKFADNVDKTNIKYSSGTLLVDGTITCSLADDVTLYYIDKTNSDKLSVLSSGSQLNSLANGTYRVYVIMDDDDANAEAIAVYAVRIA